MKNAHYFYLLGTLLFLFSVTCAPNGYGKDTRIQGYKDVVKESEELFERGEFDKLYDLTLPFAKLGDPEAQFAIGLLIANKNIKIYSELSENDRLKEMLRWINKAAIQGHINAVKFLSDSYANGWNGLKKDIEVSNCWRSVLKNPSKENKCN